MTATLVRTATAIALWVSALGAQETLPSAAEVLRELKAGNDHHVAKRYSHPHQTAARQRELEAGQHPHATILSCADSRVAPEIILDQGLGDLFDVRVAGNVPGDSELASIEYAVAHLHTPLVVVMGHQHCGAVTAATEPGDGEGHLPSLLAMIRPAVDRARTQPGNLIENAVRINVENSVRTLRASTPLLSEFVKRGELTIAGAVYALDSGKVTWLENPGPTSAVRQHALVRSDCPLLSER